MKKTMTNTELLENATGLAMAGSLPLPMGVVLKIMKNNKRLKTELDDYFELTQEIEKQYLEVDEKGAYKTDNQGFLVPKEGYTLDEYKAAVQEVNDLEISVDLELVTQKELLKSTTDIKPKDLMCIAFMIATQP